jgi:uronate dehydrogenase
MPERVLITGAAGTIGRDLRAELAGRYRLLRLLDVAEQDPAGPGEEIVRADITDVGALAGAMRGMDAVVHLAAVSVDAPFDALLVPNIVGTQRVFEAARDEGVRRIVYASSHHVSGFYPRSHPMRVSDPDRPDSHYGVSKVFGEAVARLFHDKHGIEVACLRIQSWTERPAEPRHLGSWLSPRDGAELVARCLDVERLGFAIIWGLSANTRRWVVQDDLAWLGWTPRDDAERYAEEVGPPPVAPAAKDVLDGAEYVEREHHPRYDRDTSGYGIER